MVPVRIERVNKVFPGGVHALRGINLEIAAGELFFLLGPSGCGKTTLLRLIAGLQDATSGRVLFGDRDVTNLPTRRRNAVMVFQSYALWPHMSVRENIRFGLTVRHLKRSEQGKRIEDVLRLVQMETLADRKPNQLSGGQQQRVALARALAVGPDCLLLDEPLSNLDTKLRLEMRTEIRRICKEGGVTTIYVTHDQKEALSIADRVAVMREGWIEQVGTPADLYYRPTSAFVADFIGQTNLLPGTVVERLDGAVRVETAVGVLKAATGATVPDSVVLSIRPEQVRVSCESHFSAGNTESSNGVNRFTARMLQSTFLGEASEHVLQVNTQRMKAIRTPPLTGAAATGEVTVEFDPADVVVLAK